MRDGDATRRRILNFIILYKTKHDGCSPSMREIADGIGIRSTMPISYHLDILGDEGKIRRGAHGQTRSIEVVGGRWMHKVKKIVGKFINHPDAGDSALNPLVAMTDVSDSSVCVRISTQNGDGLAEFYVEYYDGRVVLHVWDESSIDLDPSHEPVVLIKDVGAAIEAARNREEER